MLATCIILYDHRKISGCQGLLLLLCLSSVHAAPGTTNDEEIAFNTMLGGEEDDKIAAESLLDEPQNDADESTTALLNNFDMAIAQYQNSYRGTLYAKCSRGYGLYYMRSTYSNVYQDRRWTFYCRKVVQSGYPNCTSTYANGYRQPVLFMCGKNQYMAGATSYFSYSYSDRKWQFTCCSAPNLITRDCRLTKYENNLYGSLSFIASTGEVITGAYSYYSTYSKYEHILYYTSPIIHCAAIIANYG